MSENPVSGSISVRCGSRCYALYFSHRGWLAADLVQYVDDVLEAENQEIAILKLLGYTVEIRDSHPPRWADHWVEIDVEKRLLASNSEMIRKAVDKINVKPEEPYSPTAIRRLHRVLDAHDFTVELFRK